MTRKGMSRNDKRKENINFGEKVSSSVRLLLQQYGKPEREREMIKKKWSVSLMVHIHIQQDTLFCPLTSIFRQMRWMELTGRKEWEEGKHSWVLGWCRSCDSLFRERIIEDHLLSFGMYTPLPFLFVDTILEASSWRWPFLVSIFTSRP